MNQAQLESKHLAELHALAAEAGISGYRMLRREQLIERLAGEKPKPSGDQRREPRGRREPTAEAQLTAEEREAEAPAAPRREEAESSRPRRRRRRRFGRRRKGLRLADLLIPATPGRQAIVYGDSREACTALLRELATELEGGEGADPIALLVDPGPEELADWRREAPQVEIVAAAQARHAEDALAQAARRAEAGEEVVLLIDSLTRLAETLADAEAARELFGAGAGLTVVAALERR